jgi:hypothetical protein
VSSLAASTRVTLVGEGVELSLEARGAKIVSLYDVERRREWLEPPGAYALDASFDEGAMGGWDEMMPTIEACRYPGTDITQPDHGELWSREWRVSALSAASVTTTIDGESLNYRFARTITVARRSVRLDYVLTSFVDELWYLWAAHPLFAVRDATRLLVPGSYVDSGDATREVVPARDQAPGTSVKYFVAPSSESATASLVDDDGSSLTLRWSRTDAPYVGVWLDHAHYARHAVVGLEPTNAPDDSLARAAGGGIKRLTGERRWSVEVVLGDRSDTEETR